MYEAVIMYIMNSGFRKNLARGCLNGDLYSYALFDYINDVLPTLRTSDVEIRVNLLVASDAARRLDRIRQSTSMTTTINV
jgi:hypothetical protein